MMYRVYAVVALFGTACGGKKASDSGITSLPEIKEVASPVTQENNKRPDGGPEPQPEWPVEFVEHDKQAGGCLDAMLLSRSARVLSNEWSINLPAAGANESGAGLTSQFWAESIRNDLDAAAGVLICCIKPRPDPVLGDFDLKEAGFWKKALANKQSVTFIKKTPTYKPGPVPADASALAAKLKAAIGEAVTLDDRACNAVRDVATSKLGKQVADIVGKEDTEGSYTWSRVVTDVFGEMAILAYACNDAADKDACLGTCVRPDAKATAPLRAALAAFEAVAQLPPPAS